MKKKRSFLLLTLTLLAVTTASAQTPLDLPEASQAALVRQRVGVTDIAITYHRPLVNGRKVWGALVPFGEVWRAGANANTTIEFSTPVSVEGKPLPAGKYGLHMIPTPDSWTVIFSKMAVAWGSYTYDQKEDALRVQVKPRENPMEEALEFEFEDLKPDSVLVTMKWEKLAVPFRISVTDEQTVLPRLREQFRGDAQYFWASWNDAAQYCLTKKVNLEEALKWTDRSIQIEERFENVSTKADILKALNKGDEAKTVMARALEISGARQLYLYGRRMQSEKRDTEAMEVFQAVVQRFPEDVFGHLAQARIKSAAGDFPGAVAEAKQAQSLAPGEEQKKSIQGLIDRLQARQDINK